jgi:hypothetical protein
VPGSLHYQSFIEVEGDTLGGRFGPGSWVWFRLEGVSFTILPFEERDTVLRDFSGLLSSVKRGVPLARRAGMHVGRYTS